jgi:hypothetical protein
MERFFGNIHFKVLSILEDVKVGDVHRTHKSCLNEVGTLWAATIFKASGGLC